MAAAIAETTGKTLSSRSALRTSQLAFANVQLFANRSPIAVLLQRLHTMISMTVQTHAVKMTAFHLIVNPVIEQWAAASKHVRASILRLVQSRLTTRGRMTM